MNAHLGKMVVSTKKDSKKTKVKAIVAIIIFGIMVMFALTSLTRDTNEETTIIIAIVMMAALVFVATAILRAVTNTKSYCDVYEYGVSGVTRPDSKSMQTKNFQVFYNEIINVTDSNEKIIFIYTKYETYAASSLVNQAEAVNEIRKRLTK